MLNRYAGALALCLAGTGAVLAADGAQESVADAMAQVFGAENVKSVTATPVPGLNEVVLDGEVIYVSDDGRYLIQGNLVDIQERRNLTEERRSEMRADAISALDEKDMVVFAPAGEVKHTLTVFTDPDCPYCRKLHSEVPQLNAAGVKVRYLAFPRQGIPSPGYDKAVSVWCAEDRAAAMTAAKSGGEVESRTCENPVMDQLQTGMRLGVRGTPTIITETGRTFPGYVPAAELLSQLQ